jgi:hypothetical protein
MKTFETEKHNIPEGATHYFDETSDEHFAWWNDDNQMLLDPENANEWVVPNAYDDVSSPIPIPQTNIETPEEKEALDLIDTTPHQAASLTLRESNAHDVLNDAVDGVMMSEEIIPREHLVKMVEQQTIAMKCLNDELNALRDGEPEWKNGDEVVISSKSKSQWFVVGVSPIRKTSTVCVSNTGELKSFHTNQLSKPETPQQHEERERLEAAYDLYLIRCHAVNHPIVYELHELKSAPEAIDGWLAIVDKTGYRKESN